MAYTLPHGFFPVFTDEESSVRFTLSLFFSFTLLDVTFGLRHKWRYNKPASIIYLILSYASISFTVFYSHPLIYFTIYRDIYYMELEKTFLHEICIIRRKALLTMQHLVQKCMLQYFFFFNTICYFMNRTLLI